MTRKQLPKSPYGQMFKPTETPHDRTAAAAKQIIADEQQRQLDLTAKLKAARLEKEAAEASAPPPPRKKAQKSKKQ